MLWRLAREGRDGHPGAEEARMGAAPRGPMRFETRAIHAGQEPDRLYGAVNVPIYQTSTYAQPAVGEPDVRLRAGGEPHARGAPDGARLARGRRRAFAFGSGMAAETTLLLTLRPGDHVVLPDDVYGGTYRLAQVLDPWGSRSRRSTSPTSTSCASAIRDETRVVWIETPSNPLLKVVDVEAVARSRTTPAPRRRRQHVRDARAAATARARRRRRRPQRHEVPRRSLRPDRRRARDERRRRGSSRSRS